MKLLGLLILAIPQGLAGQQPPAPPAWNVTLGAGAFVMPRYPGSDEYRVLPFPLVSASYRDRVYLGPSSTGVGFALGAYPIQTSHLRLAVELGGQDSRPESRADDLAGMEDRDAVATLGMSLIYRGGSFEGSVAVSEGVNDGAGLIQTTRIGYSRSLGKLMLVAGVGVALADGRQMRREFGITEVESARRQDLIDGGTGTLEPGDALAYQPEGGLRHIGTALSLIYPVAGAWSAIGLAGLEWLSDEAAKSPLVQRRQQLLSGAGLAYHF